MSLPFSNRSRLFSAALLSFAACAGQAHAANVTWDANSGQTGIQEGQGVWDTSTSNWQNGSGSNVNFANGDVVTFGLGNSLTTSTYAITLSSGVTTGGITFAPVGSNSDYVLGGSSITLAAGAAISANVNAKITSNILGTNLIKNGGGTLILTGNNTGCTGATMVNAGILQIGDGSLGSASTLASGNASIASGATLAFNLSGTHTVSNNITGTGTLVNMAASTLVLTGANAYGATTLSAGTLQIGDGGTAGSLGNGTVTNNATLAFNRTDTYGGAISNVITGSGALNLMAGTLTLTGANNYSGTTTVAAGSTLQIGDGGIAGTLGSGAVTNNGTLAFNRTDTYGSPVSNAITGAGSLNLMAGTLTLTGANAYVGTTTIATGSTLKIGAAGTTGSLGTGAVTVNGTLALNRTDAVTLSNTFSGSGALTQTGGGTSGVASLTGDSTGFTGTVTIASGMLQLGNNGTTGMLGAGTTITVQNNAAFGLNRTDDLTFALAVSGAGSFVQNGTNNLTLTANNTNSGGTLVNHGTLTVGDGATTGAGALGTGSITLNNDATLVYNRPDAAGLIISNTITGASGTTFTSMCAGTLTLTGANSLSGTVKVESGTLQIGNGGTTGTLGSAAVEVDAGASLAFNRSDKLLTLAGVISGDGGVSQTGTGTTTLSGANTYTGTTTVSAGTLQIGGGTLGTGALAIASGATFAMNAATAATVSNAISGAGTFAQTGSGATTLTAVNAGFNGALSASAGKLALDFTDANGSSLVNNAASLKFSGGEIGFAALGNNTQSFATTTIVSAGTNKLTVSGWTASVNTGFVDLGTLSRTTGALDVGNLAGSGVRSWIKASGNANQNSLLAGYVTANGGTSYVATDANGFLVLAATSDVSQGGMIANNQGALVRIIPTGLGGNTPGGSVSLAGSGITDIGSLLNAYTTGNPGDVTLNIGSGNTLRLGAAGSVTSTAGTNLVISAGTLTAGGTTDTAGTLTFNAGNKISVSSVIADNGLGVVGLTKTGSGILVLSGTNTYTGATTINQGTLQVGSASALGNNSAVTVASGATLDLNGNGVTIGSLAGAGAAKLGGGTLTTGGDNTDTTFSGVASGTGGITKTGTGTMTLSGANTYTGATTVNAGTLVFTGASQTLSGSFSVADKATLNFGAGSGAAGAYQFTTTGAFANNGSVIIGSDAVWSFTGTNSGSGSIANNGTVKTAHNATFGNAYAGNNGSTLVVSGTLTAQRLAFNSGSTLSVDGTTLVKAVSITANSGAKLNVSATEFVKGQTKTVIETSDGITGTFTPTTPTTGRWVVNTDEKTLKIGFQDAYLPTTAFGGGLKPQDNSLATYLNKVSDGDNVHADLQALYSHISGSSDKQAALARASAHDVASLPYAQTAVTHGRNLYFMQNMASSSGFLAQANAPAGADLNQDRASHLADDTRWMDNDEDADGDAGQGAGAKATHGSRASSREKSDKPGSSAFFAGLRFDRTDKASDANGALGFASNNVGLVVGFQDQISERLLWGIMGSVDKTTVDANGAAGSSDIQTFGLGLFVRREFSDGWFAAGNLGCSWSSSDNRRDNILPGVSATSSTDGSGYNLSAFLGKHTTPWQDCLLTPIGGLLFARTETDGASESINSNPGLALTTDGSSVSSIQSVIGADLQQFYTIDADTLLIPGIGVRWLHEFGDSNATVNAHFAADPATQFQTFLHGQDDDTVQLIGSLALKTGSRQKFLVNGFLSQGLGSGSAKQFGINGGFQYNF